MAIDVTIQRTHRAFNRMVIGRAAGRDSFGLAAIGTALELIAER